MKNKAIDLSGVVTALVTPFDRGKVDVVSLRKLVLHQLDHGVQGFVISGTTAESPNLTHGEIEKIYKLVEKISDKSVPLILGIGSNSTRVTIENLKLSNRLRPDANLVVVPYYNKPTQAGMLAHFKAVANASKQPIILYNVPGRTIVSMSAETSIALSRHKNIIGIKEASCDLKVLDQLKGSVQKKFLLSSGDDSTCVDFALRGGHGVISVISHLIPEELENIMTHARLGDKVVKKEYQLYDRLNALLGVEPNPVPVKMALYLMGLIKSPELRLPLVKMTKQNTAVLKKEMRKLGLI